MKDRGMKKIYNIASIIDDFLDNEAVLKRCPDVNMLYLRRRHFYMSSFISIQKFKCVSTVIRVNTSDMYLFKLRNQLDLDASLDEFGALADKKTIEKIYRMSTQEPYGFLYVKLVSTTINDMLYGSYKKKNYQYNFLNKYYITCQLT